MSGSSNVAPFPPGGSNATFEAALTRHCSSSLGTGGVERGVTFVTLPSGATSIVSFTAARKFGSFFTARFQQRRRSVRIAATTVSGDRAAVVLALALVLVLVVFVVLVLVLVLAEADAEADGSVSTCAGACPAPPHAAIKNV